MRDIRPTATSVSTMSAPISGAAIGSTFYFGVRLSGDTTGIEPWVSDGTPAGTRLLKDINIVGDSSPSGFLARGSEVFFGAADATLGRELWKSDGTPAGTVLVKDIEPGVLPSQANPVAVVNGIVVLTATTSATGGELWRTDGTEAGTFLLADIFPGATGSQPSGFTVAGGTLYFVADDGSNGAELWATDGTVAGTRLVRDVNPGSGGVGTVSLAALGSQVCFAATTPAAGAELWISDGTAAGTTLLGDLVPGAGSSAPRSLTAFGGRVFCVATTPAVGDELFVSDGTGPGTARVVTLATGGSSAGSLLVAGTRMFFFVEDPSFVRRLHVTDGTSAGTRIVSNDYEVGSQGMIAVGNEVVLTARFSSSGLPELLRCDGTNFTSLYVGTAASPPAPRVYNGNVVAFLGSDNLLWRTTGAPASAVRFFERSNGDDSGPIVLTDMEQLGDRIVFTADDGVNGLEPWVSDGTAAGTTLLRNIHPTAGSTSTAYVVVGGRAYFRANDGATGQELWVTDGTAAGTVQVADINPGSASSTPSNLIGFDGKVYFAANRAGSGVELWVSDGTASGTVLLREIRAGTASSSPANFVVYRGALYFSADDGVNGVELWRTDGTPAGTVLAVDLVPGSSSGNFSTPVVYDDAILFRLFGSNLYRTDGTAAGTVNLNPAGGLASPAFLGVAGNLMFMVGQSSPQQLWVTDGTVAGTRLVRAFTSGTTGFAAIGGRALFLASDGVTGLELWSSDGTAAGTNLLRDIAPGSVAGALSAGFLFQVPGADRALFPARDGTHGAELWVTDGTAAGTTLLQDLEVGPYGSAPSRPVLAGCRLFFAADSVATGVELHAMATMAAAVPFGVGCPGTAGRIPRIAGAGGAPVLGNAGFGVRVENGFANSTTVMTLQFLRAELPLGNACFFYGDPAAQILVVGTNLNGSGAATFPLPIPADPNLACLQLFAQNVVVDPAGLFLNSLSVTPALKLVLAPN